MRNTIHACTFLGLGLLSVFTVTAAAAGEAAAPTREEVFAYAEVTSATFAEMDFEPYRQGAIAVSKRLIAPTPNSRVTQTTAFCRTADQQPRLMMTVAGEQELSEFALSIYLLKADAATAVEHRFAAEQIRSFQIAGNTQLSVGLDSAVAQQLEQASAFGMTLLAPESIGGFSSWHELDDASRQKINAAFSLCI